MGDRPTDDECIFCGIVREDIPARVVTTTEHTVAFLDANPLAAGHTLVVPRGHYATVGELPTDVRDALFVQLGRLAPAIETAVDADASNIGFNNGPESGQEIPHVHGHVIPRFAGDGGRALHAVGGMRPELTDEELDELASAIEAVIT